MTRRVGRPPKELRDYEVAILRTLEDGLPHSREELMRVGCATMDPHYALSMHQRREGQRAERRFEGLDTEERFAEIERQRYEGARLQVGKALSHFVDSLLVEVTEYAAPRTGNQRKVRASFAITDRGRARLSGVSGEELDANWVEEAREALLKVARKYPRFTVDDVWKAPLAKPLSLPQNPLESIFSWGVRQKFIVSTEDQIRNPSSGGNSKWRVWASLICGKAEIEWLTCDICGKQVDPMEPGTSTIVICNQIVLPPGDSSRGVKSAPFGPEATGEHWCKDCTEEYHGKGRAERPTRETFRKERRNRVRRGRATHRQTNRDALLEEEPASS